MFFKQPGDEDQRRAGVRAGVQRLRPPVLAPGRPGCLFVPDRQRRGSFAIGAKWKEGSGWTPFEFGYDLILIVLRLSDALK